MSLTAGLYTFACLYINRVDENIIDASLPFMVHRMCSLIWLFPVAQNLILSSGQVDESWNPITRTVRCWFLAFHLILSLPWFIR